MTEPAYLTKARTRIGLQEIPGVKSNPLILALWAAEKWLGTDDSLVPWCGLFMRAVMRETGFPVPSKPWAARSWEVWGVAIPHPVAGAVVVFSRKGGGHVGILVGITRAGLWRVLGGNQRDGVRVSTFDPKRATAIRWAGTLPRPSLSERLPVLADDGEISTNEA